MRSLNLALVAFGFFSTGLVALPVQASQDVAASTTPTPPVSQGAFAWLRVDALPGETPLGPREDHTGLPTRLTVFSDGTFFIGGSREILRGKLAASELDDWRRRVDEAWTWLGLRKEGLPNTSSFSEGPARYDVSILGAREIRVRWSGDPGLVTKDMGPFAELSSRLIRFRHPSVKRFVPTHYRLFASEKKLAGGCRTYRELPSFAEVAARGGAGVVVPARVAAGWVHGVDVAQACDGRKRIALTFKPLMPMEDAQ